MRFEDRTQSRPHNVNYSPPLLNGIEATRQIRKRQPQTEVLIFTMHDEEILIRSVLEARAPGYLPKADAKRYVVAAVEALAERKPFFTARVSRTLLASFLGKTSAASDHVPLRARNPSSNLSPKGTETPMSSISLKTVESHRAAALRKLNLSSTADLVRYAIRNKLVEL
jgi:DNA-binding NarL/FixJ family response regulator